jgi:NAD(P)-dependent dehydrogenase (short-subunit alcohol dehydrogenase family)
MEFQDKVVMITGAAGVLGTALSKRFQKEGALLVLIDKDKEKLDELAKQLPNGSDSIFIPADCRDDEQVKLYVDKTVDMLGTIDVLINCVGIYGPISQASDISSHYMMDVYETNVVTSFLNYKYVLPVMQKRRSGCILFVSAVFGLRGLPFFSAYSTVSHALLGFMKSAALDCVTSGVRVNAVIPAPMKSTMMEEIEEILYPDNPIRGREQILGLLPMGRYLEADEVTESVLFLASDRARYITGTSHIIDGGMTAK